MKQYELDQLTNERGIKSYVSLHIIVSITLTHVWAQVKWEVDQNVQYFRCGKTGERRTWQGDAGTLGLLCTSCCKTAEDHNEKELGHNEVSEWITINLQDNETEDKESDENDDDSDGEIDDDDSDDDNVLFAAPLDLKATSVELHVVISVQYTFIFYSFILIILMNEFRSIPTKSVPTSVS
jgi:hypothetical protein